MGLILERAQVLTNSEVHTERTNVSYISTSSTNVKIYVSSIASSLSPFLDDLYTQPQTGVNS